MFSIITNPAPTSPDSSVNNHIQHQSPNPTINCTHQTSPHKPKSNPHKPQPAVESNPNQSTTNSRINPKTNPHHQIRPAHHNPSSSSLTRPPPSHQKSPLSMSIAVREKMRWETSPQSTTKSKNKPKKSTHSTTQSTTKSNPNSLFSFSHLDSLLLFSLHGLFSSFSFSFLFLFLGLIVISCDVDLVWWRWMGFDGDEDEWRRRYGVWWRWMKKKI